MVARPPQLLGRQWQLEVARRRDGRARRRPRSRRRASTPTAPDSPMPFAPSGLTGVGVSVRVVRNARQVGGGRDPVAVEVGRAAGCRRRRRRRRSYSACAIPWATPPCTCPSASSGFTIRPASSTAASRSTRRSPVSVSSSTTATWLPNGNVDSAGAKSCSAATGRRRSAAACRQRDRRLRRAAHVVAVAVADDVGRGRPRAGPPPACRACSSTSRAATSDGRAGHLQRAGRERPEPARHQRRVGVERRARARAGRRAWPRRPGRTSSRGPGPAGRRRPRHVDRAVGARRRRRRARAARTS